MTMTQTDEICNGGNGSYSCVCRFIIEAIAWNVDNKKDKNER